MQIAGIDVVPLVGFPLEWAALALLVAGAIYWERAALSGIGIEGCVLSAMLGLCLGYEWTGDYAIAAASGIGWRAVHFLLLTAFSSASIIMAAALNPVWSAISRMQVGLVTLTSVK